MTKDTRFDSTNRVEVVDLGGFSGLKNFLLKIVTDPDFHHEMEGDGDKVYRFTIRGRVVHFVSNFELIDAIWSLEAQGLIENDDLKALGASTTGADAVPIVQTYKGDDPDSDILNPIWEQGRGVTKDAVGEAVRRMVNSRVEALARQREADIAALVESVIDSSVTEGGELVLENCMHVITMGLLDMLLFDGDVSSVATEYYKIEDAFAAQAAYSRDFVIAGAEATNPAIRMKNIMTEGKSRTRRVFEVSERLLDKALDTDEQVGYLLQYIRREHRGEGHGLRAKLDLEGEHNEEAWRRFLISLIQGTIFAGHETTGNTTSFALLALSCVPEFQEQIFEQFQNAGYRSGQAIGRNSKGMNDFPALFQVVSEVMRLLPTTNFLLRKARAEFEVEAGDTSLQFKPGDRIVAYVRGAHLNDGIFGENPLALDPDRWLDDAGRFDAKMMDHILAFGGDSIRNCVGEPFAWFSLFTIIATIINKYEIQPGTGDVGIVNRNTVGVPEEGASVFLEKRPILTES